MKKREQAEHAQREPDRRREVEQRDHQHAHGEGGAGDQRAARQPVGHARHVRGGHEEDHRARGEQEAHLAHVEPVVLDVEGAGVGELGRPRRVGGQLGQRPAPRRRVAEDRGQALAGAVARRRRARPRRQQAGHQRGGGDRAGHEIAEPPGAALGQQPDQRVPGDPGDRLGTHHPADRPRGALLAEVGGHPREAGREQAGHARPAHRARRIEEPERGRRRGERRPGEGQRAAGLQQRRHADAVDQRPDRQRHRHGHGGEHRAGQAHGADRRSEVIADRHHERREHHDRGLRGDRRQDQRQQAAKTPAT